MPARSTERGPWIITCRVGFGFYWLELFNASLGVWLVQKSDWENFPSNPPPAQEVDLLKRFGLELDDMALVLLIWLCTLPLISTLIVLFFGWQAGLTVAVGSFFLAMVICRGICSWKVFRG